MCFVCLHFGIETIISRRSKLVLSHRYDVFLYKYNGVVKLELTWQPPTQQKQHKRLQKKTPGRKKEAESAPPAGEWPRQPSPARTPPPKPAPPVQPPPKTPAKSPTTIEMVSPPGTPDVTPPPGSRWTPKTPTKSPPSQMQEDGEDDPFCGFTEDDDRSSSLQKYSQQDSSQRNT